MLEAVHEGALIEFVGSSPDTADAAQRFDRIAEAIRAVGPQFCILSSDLGQKANPLPADGFAQFLQAMRSRGFTAADIARMAKQNPAALLGLSE
jgi:predicted metal-dependent TIM-barrel fold hydrolase